MHATEPSEPSDEDAETEGLLGGGIEIQTVLRKSEPQSSHLWVALLAVASMAILSVLAWWFLRPAAGSAQHGLVEVLQKSWGDATAALPSPILLLPWTDSSNRSVPAFWEPSTSSLSRLPVCERSFHWRLLSYSGFGSQLTSILASANFARMTGRAYFLHSDQFAYGRWYEFFVTVNEQQLQYATQPEPRDYPRIAASLNDATATNNSLPVAFGVEELMDQWPIAASAPHPTPLDPREEAALSFDSFVASLQQRRLEAAADGSAAAHAFGSSVCAFALQPDLLSHPRARSVSLCRPPPSASLVSYQWPTLYPASNESAVADAVAHVSATLVDGGGLHSLHGTQLWRHSTMQARNIAAPSGGDPSSADRLLSLLGGVNPMFFWSRRRLRSMFSPKASITCQAERLLRRWSIRPKLDLDESDDIAVSRSNLSSLFPSAFPVVTTAPSTATATSPPTTRRRYVGIHLRRGDKEGELKNVHHLEYATVSRYVDAAEAFIGSEARLNASWPVMTKAAVLADHSASRWQLLDQPTADSCAAWWRQQDDALQLPQPHVVAVSDDPASYVTLRQYRPCWRWMFPAEHEFWSAEGREWRPASDRQQAAAGNTGGHSQWTFNGEPEAKRLSATAGVLIDMLLLSMADCVVLTLSSNIGRMVALSRGWWDVHVERRLTSLDELVDKWRPY